MVAGVLLCGDVPVAEVPQPAHDPAHGSPLGPRVDQLLVAQRRPVEEGRGKPDEVRAGRRVDVSGGPLRGRRPVAEVPQPPHHLGLQLGIDLGGEAHRHGALGGNGLDRRAILKVDDVEVRRLRGEEARWVAPMDLALDGPREVRDRVTGHGRGLRLPGEAQAARDGGRDGGHLKRPLRPSHAISVVHHDEGDGVRPGSGVDVRRVWSLGGRPVAEVPSPRQDVAVGVHRAVVERDGLARDGEGRLDREVRQGGSGPIGATPLLHELAQRPLEVLNGVVVGVGGGVSRTAALLGGPAIEGALGQRRGAHHVEVAGAAYGDPVGDVVADAPVVAGLPDELARRRVLDRQVVPVAARAVSARDEHEVADRPELEPLLRREGEDGHGLRLAREHLPPQQHAAGAVFADPEGPDDHDGPLGVHGHVAGLAGVGHPPEPLTALKVVLGDPRLARDHEELARGVDGHGAHPARVIQAQIQPLNLPS